MSKQDGAWARTATDLERKYNFGQTFAEVYGLARDAQNAAEQASKAVDELDEMLSQEEIFNRLTNYGENQGMYRDGDDIYFNASYIKSGKLAADYIDAENLKVDAANVEGTLTIGQLPEDVATEEKVTTIIDGTITTDYLAARGITVDAANVTGQLKANQIKLGGDMDLYESMESETVVGRFGFQNVTINGVEQRAIGFTAEGYGGLLAATGDMRIASENDIELYGDTLRWNGTAVTLVSDARKKKDIDYSANDKLIAIFDNLKPVTYKMVNENVDDFQQHIGFIAQDVKASVEAAGLNDALVSTDYKGFYVLNYSEITAILTAKIQQLEAEIRELKAKHE